MEIPADEEVEELPEIEAVSVEEVLQEIAGEFLQYEYGYLQEDFRLDSEELEVQQHMFAALFDSKMEDLGVTDLEYHDYFSGYILAFITKSLFQEGYELAYKVESSGGVTPVITKHAQQGA
jgi:hypothetical protein